MPSPQPAWKAYMPKTTPPTIRRVEDPSYIVLDMQPLTGPISIPVTTNRKKRYGGSIINDSASGINIKVSLESTYRYYGQSGTLPPNSYLQFEDYPLSSINITPLSAGAIYSAYAWAGGYGGGGYVIRVPGAVSSSLSGLIQVFTVGQTIVGPTGAITLITWQAPQACHISNIRAIQDVGSGSTFTALHGVTAMLASPATISAAATWIDGGTVTNNAFASGDTLQLELASISGSPNQITIQANGTIP